MNNELTLDHLHAAKKAHISWVSKAKALIEGLPIEKNQIPVDCTACKFGEWFYSDAQSLKAIPGMDCLALRYCIIPTITFSAHTLDDPMFK